MRSVPKSFELLGHEITVEFRDDLLAEKEAWGMCHFQSGLIELQAPLRELRVTKAHVLATFWHEFFHMALYLLGRTDMALDEELVDQLGQAMLQFHKTKQFS
ncbi:MAG: hypothetical protein AAF628_08380 [Planctomycetota bacterium]